MTIELPTQKPTKPTPPAGILRGPADASAFRVTVKRSRWYADPLPACDMAPATDGAWPSVSAVKKAKPFAFGNYTAMKRIAKHAAAEGIDLSRGFDANYSLLKMIDGNAMKLAQNRGKHVHWMIEQILYGLNPRDTWRDPDTGQRYKFDDAPGAAYLPAVLDFFDVYQPELVAAEFVCIHRDLNGVGYGGTADAALKIEGGLYKVDWKSRDADGDHAAYAEEGAQIAGYAKAQYAIADGGDGIGKRIPVPAFDGGLIASIKPDGVRLYPIDLDKAWIYFEALHAFWSADRDCDAHTGKPWAARTKVATPVPPAEVAAGGGPASPARTPYVVPVPVAKAPIWTAKPADEGDEVDAKTVKRLVDGFMNRNPLQQAAVTELLKEAQRAGVPFGQVAKNPTKRRFELGRAALWIVDHCSMVVGGLHLDTDLVRAAMRLVIGDLPPVEHAPLGALLGTFTADEAASLCLVLDGITAGTYVADYSTNSLLLRRAS